MCMFEGQSIFTESFLIEKTKNGLALFLFLKAIFMY